MEVYVNNRKLLRSEGRDMILDGFLDLTLKFWCHGTGSDLLEESSLGSCEVLTELSLPLGDLVNGDGVEETIDAGVDDGDLDFGGQRLVLTLLCKDMSKTLKIVRSEETY